MLGEHQEELAVARRARRLFPKLVNLELPALAALGRTEEVQALLEQSETGKACSVLRAGGELLLHDHLDPASQLLDRGIMQGQAWLSTLPTDTTSSHIGYNITCLADMLLLRGRVDEARVVLEQAVEQRADRPSRRRSHIGTLGIIAGMQGDRRKALEIDQYLAAEPWTWPSNQVWWHAQIAASLGEIDEATAILQEAVSEGSMPVAEIHLLTPLLSWALRDHPPFQELVRPKG